MRIAQAAAIIDVEGRKGIQVLGQQLDRPALRLRIADCRAQDLGLEREAIHRHHRHVRRQARLERRAAPAHVADQARGIVAIAIGHAQANGIHQVDFVAARLVRLGVPRRHVGPGQRPSAAGQPVQRRLVAHVVQALAQELAPAAGLHGLERRDDIVEAIATRHESVAANPVEGAGEVVDRALAAAHLADARIHVQPQQGALGVEVHAALVVRPGTGGVVQHLCFVSRVLQGAPGAASLAGHARGCRGQVVPVLLGRPQAGTRGQHFTQILRQALVHPQQFILHGGVEAGGEQSIGTAELAVPAVHVFVRQQACTGDVLVGIGEVFRFEAIIAALVVLEAEMAGVVGQREQEVVVAVVVAAKQFLGLDNQVPVIAQLRVGEHQVGRGIGNDVQMHGRRGPGRQVDATEIEAGDQRRIHKLFQRHDAEARASIRPDRALGLKRRPHLPPRRQLH